MIRLRLLEVAVLLVLAAATAYEAAIALEWIPVGTEPGQNARFEGLMMALGLIALAAAFVVSLALAARNRRSVRAALFAPAAAALMVARFYTFDTYYLPDMTRYSEGEISATWVYGLAVASVVAAFSSFAKPRAGFGLAAAVILLCLLTANAFGIGK